MEEATFAETKSGTELTGDCNSTAVNLSIPCNHSKCLNSTPVSSTLLTFYPKDISIFHLVNLWISRDSLAINISVWNMRQCSCILCSWISQEETKL